MGRNLKQRSRLARVLLAPLLQFSLHLLKLCLSLFDRLYHLRFYLLIRFFHRGLHSINLGVDGTHVGVVSLRKFGLGLIELRF